MNPCCGAELVVVIARHGVVLVRQPKIVRDLVS